MDEITRVGVDLAKRVIQVHAVNAAGRGGRCQGACARARCALLRATAAWRQAPIFIPNHARTQPQFLPTAQPKGRRAGAPILQMGR